MGYQAQYSYRYLTSKLAEKFARPVGLKGWLMNEPKLFVTVLIV